MTRNRSPVLCTPGLQRSLCDPKEKLAYTFDRRLGDERPWLPTGDGLVRMVGDRLGDRSAGNCSSCWNPAQRNTKRSSLPAARAHK